MKPANFPGRRLTRLLGSLRRMENSPPLLKDYPGHMAFDVALARWKEAVANTQAAIAACGNSETRSKKDRSARGKFQRSA